MTYKEYFFDCFPNAPKMQDGTPVFCVDDIYPQNDDDPSCNDCAVCWNQTIPSDALKINY